MKTEPESVGQRRALRQALGEGQWGVKQESDQPHIGGSIPLHGGGPVEESGSYKLLAGEFVAPRAKNGDWTEVRVHRIGEHFMVVYDNDEAPIIVGKPQKK